jgi:predicted  nucleic acid-binding Zn-ribbon protein
MTITEVRIRWATTREAMRTTCIHINQLEDELASARSTKRNLQRELTELEIREKELLGQIKYCGSSVEARKSKVAKSVTSSVKEAFSGLSDEAKAELVKEILGGLEL